MTTHETATSLGSIILGNFRLLSVLAAGSYATAYLAEQLGIERKVVVKVAHPHLMSSHIGQMIRTRFHQELKVMAKINHPNLVTLFSAGDTPDGLPALVMEYVEGRTLTHLFSAYAPLQFHQYDAIFRQLLGALGALHAIGIVHRDVTPHNIIVSRTHDGKPHVKLLDFGVAQQENISNGTLGPIGTPRYLSPEQIQNRATPASDIFSVGALLWWATTGSEFMANVHHIGEYIAQILAMKSAPDPRSVNPNLSPSIAQFISSLLHPNPDQRPSQSQVLTYLESLRQNEFSSSPKSNPRHPTSTSSSNVDALSLSTSSNVDALSLPSLLIIDPHEQYTRRLRADLRPFKCRLICTSSVNDAAAALNSAHEPFDIILCVADGLDFSPSDIIYWLRDSLGDFSSGGPSIILISDDPNHALLNDTPDALLPTNASTNTTCDLLSNFLQKQSKKLVPLTRVTNPNMPTVSRATGANWPAISSPQTNPTHPLPSPFDLRPTTGKENDKLFQQKPKDFIGKMPNLLVELSETHANPKRRTQICQYIILLANDVGAHSLAQQSHLLASLPPSASPQEIDALIDILEHEYARAFRALVS